MHPQAKRLGVGSQLFAALLETGVRLTPPVTRIERIARTGNAAAIRLYERLGFRVEGRFVGQPAGRPHRDDMPMARIAVPASGSV